MIYSKHLRPGQISILTQFFSITNRQPSNPFRNIFPVQFKRVPTTRSWDQLKYPWLLFRMLVRPGSKCVETCSIYGFARKVHLGRNIPNQRQQIGGACICTSQWRCQSVCVHFQWFWSRMWRITDIFWKDLGGAKEDERCLSMCASLLLWSSILFYPRQPTNKASVCYRTMERIWTCCSGFTEIQQLNRRVASSIQLSCLDKTS